MCLYIQQMTVLASTVSMSRHTCVTKHFVNETQSPSRPWRCAGEVWSHGDTASAPVGVSSLSGSEKRKTESKTETEFWHNCSHFECSSTDLIYTLIKLIYVVPLHSALASDVWWYNLSFKKTFVHRSKAHLMQQRSACWPAWSSLFLLIDKKKKEMFLSSKSHRLAPVLMVNSLPTP